MGAGCSSSSPPPASPGGSGGNHGGSSATAGNAGSGGSTGGANAAGAGGGEGGESGNATGEDAAADGSDTSSSADASGAETSSAGDATSATDIDATVSGPDAGLGPLPAGMKVVYVLHDANAGSSATDPSRKSLLDMLSSMHDSHGIVVKMADSPTPAAMMPDAALIIVGPNASMFEHHPAPDLKTVAVPLMVSKDGHTDEIGLGTVLNTDAVYDTIHLMKVDHPLAAGLSAGTIQVLTTTKAQRLIRFSNLGPDAIKIATGPVDNNTWSIIGYEKGATMAGGFKAPAKRVGFFWHRPAAVTPDGEKLFKAAVDWLLRP